MACFSQRQKNDSTAHEQRNSSGKAPKTLPGSRKLNKVANYCWSCPTFMIENFRKLSKKVRRLRNIFFRQLSGSPGAGGTFVYIEFRTLERCFDRKLVAKSFKSWIKLALDVSETHQGARTGHWEALEMTRNRSGTSCWASSGSASWFQCFRRYLQSSKFLLTGCT